MCEIADTIERDIARALQPKPKKVYESYWTIYEKDSFGSYHSYKDYISFDSYEDAESFLLRDTTIVKAEQKYVDRQFFGDWVIFQSTTRYMSDTSDGEQIPVLYSIHNCYYDHYPYEADVLELSAETIDAMKEAYRQIHVAEIYATCVDRVMSGDDEEDGLQERLSADLEAFGKEFQAKDWTCSYEDNED